MPAYQIEQSTAIKADVDQVFDTVADYRTWTTWSPWLIAEPEAEVTVSTDSTSVGSTYAWRGKVTGQGELEHQQLMRPRAIEDELRFIKPFKSTAKTGFQLATKNDATQVTWTMEGKLPWFMFWMVPMVKTFVAMDFRRGLAMLKDHIELGSIPSKTTSHGIESIAPIRMAGVVGKCHFTEIGKTMEQSFTQAEAEFKRIGLPTTGPMISVYTKFKVGEGVFEYISGYIIPDDAKVDSEKLKEWSISACRAFRVNHLGAYRHLGNGWSVANQLVRHQKLKQRGCATFEIYRTAPPAPESQLNTDIYLPLK